ncbi:hypothetical protein SAMN05428642_101287 [Flaviramulus basaltis]|uniref:Polysaccharide lyase n=1 Tax=Flaviramulus basaltis TaxID=369401 RepID=A0A1K2IB00_9FLAO|nr:hypothetical protein [Flaviramulus basaltis]SFZ89450.1 hypothetical protein SAMN05428642_101287 [Flaviramulus basaltis]
MKQGNIKIHFVCIVICVFHEVFVFGQSRELIFKSGFEEGTTVTQIDHRDAEIKGIDTLNTPKGNWETNLEGAPNNCEFKIYYQDGDESMRIAKIVSDPINPKNHVALFKIDKPNVFNGVKGRIQANMYNCKEGFKNLTYSIRLFLLKDLDLLKSYPDAFTWFTLMAFWNDAPWVNPETGFRITVGLHKPSEGNDSLKFGIHGQVYNPETKKQGEIIWEETNNNFAVPTGKWMTLKVNFVEGDEVHGRFQLTAIVDEKEIGIFNIQNWTYHPDNPNPDGLTHHNPFMLYTSGKIINYLNAKGKSTHVYWDDYEVWGDYKKQ